MIDALEEFGLNQREIKIYLALLGQESATASHLAKITKVNRTTVYLELNNLLELGLVSHTIKQSKKHFHATSPDKLVAILDHKKSRIEAILPDLNQLHNKNTHFATEVLEGKEGIKTFYLDVLQTAKDILVFGATGKALEVMKYSYPHIVKKLVKANIKERALANSDAKTAMEKHPQTHVHVKYFPKQFTAKVTTIIYGEKVALHSLQKEKMYVILLTDANLAETYRNHFEFMWSML